MSRAIAVLLLALLLAGCDESLDHQNRFKTLGRSDLTGWPAEGEALMPVPGTVAQGDLERARQVDEPQAVSLALLREGRVRYDVYCASCHGLTGAGDGIVVQRGFPKPAPLDDKRLLEASASRMVDVIGSGYGKMFGFADRVDPQQRWAIVAYIRALQLAEIGKPRS
jgi:mono/diheme cytochrome c family protein